MDKFRFLHWEVYKDSQELFKFILEIIKNMPKEYRYEIGSQLIRSGFSVVLNIAEGSGKGSDRELNRFLDISLGSLYEVLASVDTMRKCNLISEKDFKDVLSKCDRISNELGGFKKKIKSCWS